MNRDTGRSTNDFATSASDKGTDIYARARQAFTTIRKLRILKVHHSGFDTPSEPVSAENFGGTDTKVKENPRIFLVLKGDDEKSPVIRATGIMAEKFLNVGAFYDFTGKWQSNEKYGRIFRFVKLTPTLPDEEDMVREFLSNKNFFKGLPSNVVDAIIRTLGPKALYTIRDEGDKALKGIKGVGKVYQKKIPETIRNFDSIYEVYSTLFNMGISPSGIFDICYAYRNETIKSVLDNPYQVSKEHPVHMPFSTADRIFIQRSFSKGCFETDPFSSLSRIRSGIMEAFASARNEGHTFLHEGEAVRMATDILMVNPVFAISGIPDPDRDVLEPMVAEMLKGMVADGTLLGVQGLDDLHIYLPKLRAAELDVAERLVAVASHPLPPDVESTLPTLMMLDENKDGFEYSFEQMEAISAAMTNMFIVITGGPGTGKTTIMSEIVRRHLDAGRTVSLAAPTAKAADRMADVTGLPACTIQRLLGFRPKLGPVKNSEHPIESDVVIVDEFSMVDIELFAQLLDAVSPGTFLVAIGDVDQLPSVGPGNVLHDIIDSGVFAVRRLSLIFRQKGTSSIPELADSINRGTPLPFPKNPHSAGFIYDWCGSEDLGRHIDNIMHKAVNEYYVTDINQVRVITPLKSGPYGSQRMSDTLRDSFGREYAESFRRRQMTRKDFKDESADRIGSVAETEDCFDENGREKTIGSITFRPYGEEAKSRTFRIGDRVIQNVNCYRTGIMNGDEGFVVGIEDKNETGLLVDFNGKILKYTEEDVIEANLETSYAITVHKCQGSEYPCVIFVLPPASSGMVNRRLIYTAVTRAKGTVFIVGSREAFYRGVGRMDGRMRNSGLKDALLEAVPDDFSCTDNKGFYNVVVNGKKVPIFNLTAPVKEDGEDSDDFTAAF